MITGDQAINKIVIEFPEIAGELHEETIDGLLHCQMAEFSRFAQMKIDRQDRESFRRICDLFVELFNDAEPRLENALNVSFLEHLDFADADVSRSWGYRLMPVKMRQAFDEMAAYNERIHGG
jgi:glutathione S-transferase